MIGANQDAVFKHMAAAMGHPEWICEGGPFATHEQRGERQLELDWLIAEWTRPLSTDALLRATDEAGVRAGRIYRAADIACDPHYAACHMIVELPDPALSGETVRMQGVVPVLSGAPARVARGGPPSGEHNNEIWGGLVGAARLRDLRKRAIV